MAEYLAMLIDEVPKQIEYFSQFFHFLKKFAKMSNNVCDKMHGGCNFESNFN